MSHEENQRDRVGAETRKGIHNDKNVRNYYEEYQTRAVDQKRKSQEGPGHRRDQCGGATMKSVVCKECGDWIGLQRYGGTRLLCKPCGTTKQRLYDQVRRYRKDKPKRRHVRTRPMPPPLTEEEILEGARIGRELQFIDIPVWDQVDLATFGPGAWPMFTERDEEDSDEAAM